MTFLDILLFLLGLSVGVWSYFSWRDSLYKLFIWLVIGFLSFLVVSYQIHISELTHGIELRAYDRFLLEHKAGILNILFFCVPTLGIFFMLHPRIIIETRPKSISHILLGMILPFFMMWMIYHTQSSFILGEHFLWNAVRESFLYGLFEYISGLMFYLIAVFICYKFLFLALLEFAKWIKNDCMAILFASWGRKKKRRIDEEEDLWE